MVVHFRIAHYLGFGTGGCRATAIELTGAQHTCVNADAYHWSETCDGNKWVVTCKCARMDKVIPFDMHLTVHTAEQVDQSGKKTDDALEGTSVTKSTSKRTFSVIDKLWGVC